MLVGFRRVDFPFRSVFRVAYRTRTSAETVRVELKDGDFVAHGEGLAVSYRGETIDSMLEQLKGIHDALADGLSREALQSLLPAGGARNAVDCALWDLEAKRAGRRAWELAGIHTISPLFTDYTLSLDSPESMGRAAKAAAPYSTLKLKLGGDADVERVAAVRIARPEVALIVDANQSWTEDQLREFAPRLAALRVKLIEQPLPVGRDDMLAEFKNPIPFCADESCQTRASLPNLIRKYQFLNIKLDKTGGLTEALALARDARAQGFELMAGCTAGSSLSMAPAFILGQLCRFADLDGPLLSAADIPHPIRYEGSRMYPPERALWG